MRVGRQRLLVPEVVQTSAMDCGPASLKCLLEGFGIPVSYGRLREACQTDVDGTSIDTMEDIAVQLGLEAEQIMVPADYVLLDEAEALPAIAVVVLTSGVTHFVVAWRCHGGLVQVMDPGVGRRWPSREQFVSTLHVHTQLAPLSVWREWATSEKFLSPLRRKLTNLGCSKRETAQLVEGAAAHIGWRPLAALEASTRTLEALVHSSSIRRGSEVSRVLERFYEGAAVLTDRQPQLVPAHFWSVRAAAPAENGEERIYFRGAVLVHAGGRRQQKSSSFGVDKVKPQEAPAPPLSPELVAALEEKRTRPGIELFHLIASDGVWAPLSIVAALLLTAAGVIIEALLFRGLLDLAHSIGLPLQRMAIMGALLVFVAALLLLEFPIAAGLLGMGRRLEVRLRMAFLRKIPRLGDRYFHSRLNSDMASRCHQIHRIRLLPYLGGHLLRSTFELLLTVAGIIWLDPGAAWLAIAAGVVAVGFPLLMQPVLAERDMRLENHAGALSRHYLDAFLGLVPLRTHRAERALRREHENLLREWTRAALSLERLVLWAEGAQFFASFGLAGWLLIDHVSRMGELGSVLLLVYWALNVPALGQDIAQIAWQYPANRNRTLRLLEPLGAPEEAEVLPSQAELASVRSEDGDHSTKPVAISFENVSLRVSGHTILEDVQLTIEPGSHVAVIGPTGAGKSSLVGAVLGWYKPAAGRVIVDGLALEGTRLDRLRAETVWVDPAVQIWNRTLLDNLRYGSAADSIPTAELLAEAELHELLEKLPDGLQTELGESGALVSGGEGQRVRLGRAMHKSGVRLAILDEPFRGLDRQQRRALLARARRHWRNATLICVTHDVGETLSFERVLVVEAGRVMEDGAPETLACRPDSRYLRLLQAETDVRERLWSSAQWQHWRLEDGQLRRPAQEVRA
jgi:ABC-type bacteriocin/lantibiotic exporter with double-glycine peptidase domain